MLLLLVAALVILGPERLPGAVRWTVQSLRQVRDYATGATTQLRQELGPEFDDLRKPLSDLQELRGMSPKSAVAKHLLNGDDSFFKDFEDPLAKGKEPPGSESGKAGYPMPKFEKPLERNEPPPIDTDAT